MDPRVKPGGDEEKTKPLLLVEKLVKEYPRQGATATLGKLFGRKPPVEQELFRAVDGISFTVGKARASVSSAKSGCGKSTTSMMVMRLLDQTSGRIVFDGEEIGAIMPNASRGCRCAAASRWCSRIRPTASIRASPRYARSPIRSCSSATSGAATAARPLRGTRHAGRSSVNLLDRFPHQLSGGQKARVGIARAMALHPKLVVLDEPTAALDVSVQAVVLNLLQDLKASMGMSYLFVSHDLNVVRLLCDRVIVMRSGRNRCRAGTSERVLGDPQDAYTKELLTAIPHPPLPVQPDS